MDNMNGNKNSTMQTLSSIPTPNENAKEIVALVKESGVVSGYKLSDGKIITKEEGVSLAKQGGIKGVGVATNDGTEYLRSLPDQTESNNLSSLPTITQ